MRGVAVGADASIRERHAFTGLDHRRHFLQVDLVHDAVARRDHVDVLERLLGPVDEVETVFVATVFDGAVLVERLRVETATFHGQRVVDDELGRYHRVDQRRVTTLVGNGVAQAGQVHQCGLAKNVVAHHTCREPWEVQIALAFDELVQRCSQCCRVATADQVFCQNTRGVRQCVVGARADCVDCRAGVVVIQPGAGQ
ncbi:hypothetical protein D9M71_474030 [compost metagenome]